MANVDQQVVEKFLYQDETSPVLDRSVVWQNDESQSYNGQIVFNLQQLGTTNKWLSYQEAYIEIPYVVSLSADQDISGAVTSRTITPKDAFYQIIDSISVEINGKTVHQQQSFNNVHSYFKAITSMSKNYLDKHRSTNGLYLDSIEQKSKNGAAASILPANTYYNNTSAGVNLRNTELISGETFNTLDSHSLPAIKDAGGSFYTTSADAGALKKYYWVIMCMVKLSDITDFFNKLPLCKTTDVRLLINYNATNISITRTVAVGPPATDTITASTVAQVSGNTCPYIITIPTVIAATTTLTFQSNVMGTPQGKPDLALNACRLYVPVYDIEPQMALNMIKIKPITTIRYNDVYTFQITNKSTGADVVETISSGIVNAKYIVVLPFVYTSTLLAWQNPYDTAPATTSNIILQNFQVQLGGKNVFRADVRYDFNMFIDELAKMNALEGDNDMKMNSGILRQYLFQNSHRMYVADLSRHNQSESLVSKSIVVSFKNASPVAVSCLVFVAYGRSVSFDTATGISTDMITAK